ncbi:MAG: glycosyltransferase [Cyanobacteria bacterium J06649_12]
MRIAIIASGFRPVVDGVTVALYHRLRLLSQWGHEILLLCPDYEPLATLYPRWRDYLGEIFPGVQVMRLPSEPFMGVAFERNLSRQAQKPLQQALAEFEPTLIHVDEPDRIFLGLLKAPGVAYARAHGIPCVGFYHTNFIDYLEDYLVEALPLLNAQGVGRRLKRPAVAIAQWFSMLFIRPVFHAYDVILVSCAATQTRLEQLRVRNLYPGQFLGVDASAFDQVTRHSDFFERVYALPDISSKLTLMFLGRLTPDKGWHFTLRALADWVHHPSNAPLLDQVVVIVAGDGAMRDVIQSTLKDLGLRAYFLGRIAPEAVPALLVNSDIHITTSEKETLGLTVLEALCAGIPAIAPRAGGVVTHIQDGTNGRLYAPQSSKSFGQALSELVTDAPKRRQMGERGKQAAARYDWKTAVQTLLNTWQTQIAPKT